MVFSVNVPAPPHGIVGISLFIGFVKVISVGLAALAARGEVSSAWPPSSYCAPVWEPAALELSVPRGRVTAGFEEVRIILPGGGGLASSAFRSPKASLFGTAGRRFITSASIKLRRGARQGSYRQSHDSRLRIGTHAQ